MYNFEQIGFIPRSIVRTLKRFIKQISLKTDLFVIYEFRISRYIAIASIQCFFFLIICPWIFQIFMKFLLINVFFQYKTIAKVIPTDIFLNFHQQERAFSQIQTFSQKVYFETLFESFKMDKRNHEAMALSRCNTFASACRSTTSLSPNPLTPLHLASAHRKAMQDMYYNPNIEKSTSFDHLFNFKKTVLDFVVIAKRYPKRGIHKFELVSPSYCQRAGSGHREAMPAFKAQPDLSIAANSFALPPGPSPSISIHWIVPQSRAVASDMGSEQIFKKDFRFQVPTTQILRSAASPFQKSIYEIYQTYFLKLNR